MQGQPGSEIQQRAWRGQRKSAGVDDESNPIVPNWDGWQDDFKNADLTMNEPLNGCSRYTSIEFALDAVKRAKETRRATSLFIAE